MSRAYQEQFLRGQVKEYEQLLADGAGAAGTRAHRNLIKSIEKQKAAREERLKELAAREKKDDGLAEQVRQHLGNDPLSGHVFVFRNKRGDRVKLLYWDEDGFVIVYKKQEAEYPHPFAFTKSDELAHNLAPRLA